MGDTQRPYKYLSGKGSVCLLALLVVSITACDSGPELQRHTDTQCDLIHTTSSGPVELFGEYLDLRVSGPDAYLATPKGEHLEVTPRVQEPDILRIAFYDSDAGLLRLEPVSNGTTQLILDARSECGEEARFTTTVEVTSFLGCLGACRDMWPLAVGNRWEYSLARESTSVGSPTTTIEQDVTIEITGRLTVDSDTIYTVLSNTYTHDAGSKISGTSFGVSSSKLDGTITEDRYGRLSVSQVVGFPISEEYLISRYQPEGGASLHVGVTESPPSYRFEYVLKEITGPFRTEHEGPYGSVQSHSLSRMTLTGHQLEEN